MVANAVGVDWEYSEERVYFQVIAVMYHEGKSGQEPGEGS